MMRKKRLRTALAALLITLGLGVFLSAPNSQSSPKEDVILQCLAQSEDWAGRFVLTETGQFFLKGKKGKEAFDCDLKLKNYDSNPEAVVPHLTLAMTLSSCRKADGTPLQFKTLLQDMTLVIHQKARKGKTALVQWITYLQPSQCKIEVYNSQSLIRNAEKFKRGLLR